MLRAAILSVVFVGLMAVVGRAAVAEEVRCEGTIVAVEGEMVTVKSMDQEQRMKIEPATKITSASKPVMPSDLKVDQKVKCVCERKQGAMICTAMELMRDTP